MKKHTLLYICMSMLVTISRAQTSLLTERLHHNLSPSEERYDYIAADMDIRLSRILYCNPSFHEVVRNDSLYKHSRYLSAIYTTFGNGASKGDFLPFEGNFYNDFRIAGMGKYSHSAGTLFGSAQYARGVHKNIGWSATRNQQLYQPYISTDSIGGDSHYEDYRVEGGYSFCISDWQFGVSMSFIGEQAWRKSDPRMLNNTTWLRASVGAAHSFGGHMLMLRGGYGRNKQHLSLRYWRPGQQDRFFVTYGFGLYDVRNSAVMFGYSRMYYIDEFQAGIDYASTLDKKITLNAGIGLCHNDMKAEESDIQTLYMSKTLSISPYLMLNLRATSRISFSLFAEADIEKRKGYENIFEEYLIDKDNNIYDFRRIATQQNYTLDVYKGLARMRMSYALNANNNISITGGTALFMRKEKYSSKGYAIKNSSIFPHCRVEYRMNNRRSEYEIGILYGRQIRLNGSYNVDMQNNSIEHLDFQYAFTPYAYYNSTYSTLTLNTTYVLHFGSYGIGASLRLMLTDGKRNGSTAYTQKIGFESSAPMIKPTPDKHDERWGNLSLFFVF